MPLERQAGQQIAASLCAGDGARATPAQVADAVVAAWLSIDLALSPIIGQLGVAALYKRSNHLNRSNHAALAPVLEGGVGVMDTALLRSVLVQYDAAEAAAIAAAVLQTFYDLLTNLVGPSLTERLLRSTWAHFASGPPALET